MHVLYAIFLTILLFITQPVFADDLLLTRIGGMDTKGVKYNQWWYEPQRVVLKGAGNKGVDVAVTLDGKSNTVKSDVNDGSWSFDAGTLDIADHHVVIASGDQSYSFILTIGSFPPADMGTTKGGLPTAGGILPLAGLVVLAGGLIYMGLRKSEV